MSDRLRRRHAFHVGVLAAVGLVLALAPTARARGRQREGSILRALAGPNIHAIAGEQITLNGRALGLGAAVATASYRWKVVLAPRGSKARFSAPDALQSAFVPNRPGIYRLALTVRAGGRSAASEVTVTDTADYPPIGAAVDTMARNGSGLQVGTRFYSFAGYFNPTVCDALNVALVDRYTLAVPYSASLSGGVHSAGDFIAEIKSLIGNGQLNNHPFVIISDTLQNRNSNCTAVNSAWNPVLSQIGGVPLPNNVQARGGWSVVGIYGGAKASAWENDGNSEPDDILIGSMSGYLQNDYTGPFSFVPSERIKVDLDAPGATGGQNSILVGGSKYASGALSCGTGGFQVVTLNAVTLAQLSGKTIATNGCGTGTDAANQLALVSYLNGVAQSSPVTQELVLIQSIGSPYDASASATWQQLDSAVAGVGGTPTVLASDTRSYSLIGSVGISDFPLAEGSGTATPKNPAHVTAVLKRGSSYAYEPNLSSAAGMFGFDLATLAYQPSQQFNDSAGELKALNYISGPNVLDLPVPTAGTGQNFCYVPPAGQLDVRYAYCDPLLQGQWLGSQFANDLRNIQWSSNLGFSKQDLANAVHQLLPQRGHGEFAEVAEVWTAIDDLVAATTAKGQSAIAIAQDEAAQIHHALEGATHADTVGKWFDVIANSLNALGSLFPNEGELAEPVNQFAAGLYLSEDVITNAVGSPALGKFSVSAANFVEDLATAYQNAGAGLSHVLGLIVTDPGKLKSFYANSASYTYTPTQDSNAAFRLGAAAFGWQSLLPSAYVLTRLPRHNVNDGVTDAKDYSCDYWAGRTYGPYAPFPDSPLSGQLVNSQLYVLTEQGDVLPDGYHQRFPQTPPKSLTDPLFAPYASSNGVITSFGLYQPWFYRQAYDPPSVGSLSC